MQFSSEALFFNPRKTFTRGKPILIGKVSGFVIGNSPTHCVWQVCHMIGCFSFANYFVLNKLLVLSENFLK